ncbi:MAG: lysozyme [Desulfovibrio sp.]|jgi:lysozyme|nr:lysozyme [Desulfovibrio sp.]
MAALPKSKIKGVIAAVVLATGISAGAAALLVPEVVRHEGEVLHGYLDPIGIPTKCYGDTRNVIVGKAYSQNECLDSLSEQLGRHINGVLRCAPGVEHSEQMTAAFSLLAYNIGEGAFCRSSVARRFKAGDYAGACSAIEMWDKAGGKVLAGLVKRRAEERALCERGLAAMEAAR